MGSDKDRLWKGLASELRADILSGALEQGAKLPASAKLADQHGVTRQTVQTALDRLIDEGLVESRRGVGWFVRRQGSMCLLRTSRNWRDRNARPAYDQKVGSWHPDVRLKGRNEHASWQVALDLGVTEGTEVWVRHRRLVKDNQALLISDEYLPREITRGTAIENSTVSRYDGGTYSWLRKAGHRIARFTEKVEVVSASDVDAIMLGLDTRRPSMLLRITRIAHGVSRPLEVNYIITPAKRLTLVYELPGFD
jgi:GntR family transcriptional regulator